MTDNPAHVPLCDPWRQDVNHIDQSRRRPARHSQNRALRGVTPPARIQGAFYRAYPSSQIQPDATPGNENDYGIDSDRSHNVNYRIMTKEEIAEDPTEYFGLDGRERFLALRYAAAAKAVAQRTPYATEDEVRRLSDLARLRSLELDFYQRSQAVVLPPGGLENDAQYRAACQLPSTVQKMQPLQRQFDETVTARSPLVREAHSKATAYYRAQRELEDSHAGHAAAPAPS